MFVAKVVIVLTLITGWASQYSPGVMSRVVRVRQSGATAKDLPLELPDVDGFVAMEDCDRVGDIIYARPVGEKHWESFLVADCSGHEETTAWMLRGDGEYPILIEVDHPTAVRWNTVGYGKRIEIREIEVVQNYLPY